MFKKGVRIHRDWTPEEDLFVTVQKDLMSNSEIGTILNRTPEAVCARFYTLNLKREYDPILQADSKKASRRKIQLNKLFRSMEEINKPFRVKEPALTLEQIRKRQPSHIIWNRHNPNDPIRQGDGCCIHHKDGNHDNNDPNNLEKMLHSEHTSYHWKGRSRLGQNEHLKTGKDLSCPICNKKFYRAKWGLKKINYCSKKCFYESRRIKKINRICPICQGIFKVSPNKKQECCSRYCGFKLRYGENYAKK